MLILHLSYVTIIFTDLFLYSLAHLHSKVGPNVQLNYGLLKEFCLRHIKYLEKQRIEEILLNLVETYVKKKKAQYPLVS